MGRRYIYPPYPDQRSKVHPDQLAYLDRTGHWLCQRKFGGSRAVVKVRPGDGACEVWDRHGGTFATLSLTAGLRDCLLGLRLPADEYWLDGEWLQHKAKVAATGRQAVTETIVLFDVLYAGRYLIQSTQQERLDILAEICDLPTRPEPGGRALQVAAVGSAQVWMAETFPDDFEYRFYEFVDSDDDGNDRHPEIEGVVLRHRNFRLTNPGFREYRVKGDVLRCRKPGTARTF
jgi:hypothetical protein